MFPSIYIYNIDVNSRLVFETGWPEQLRIADRPRETPLE